MRLAIVDEFDAEALSGLLAEAGFENRFSTCVDDEPPKPDFVDGTDLYVLCRIAERAAEWLVRSRSAVENFARVSVCLPRVGPRDGNLLRRCGADAVISPVEWHVPEVAERISGDLIARLPTDASTFGCLRGGSLKLKEVYTAIAKLAPYDEPVLILGESGTGKELVAKEIHVRSGRPGQDPFVKNCAEFSLELVVSELFGHKKGAFTSAADNREGFFRAAGNGTAFLDEFGELDAPLQARLLRVLEYNEVQPLGDDRGYPVKARVVLATNRDLSQAIERGEFRRDLYQRVAGSIIRIPPLRDRKADIPMLAEYFLREFNRRYGRQNSIASVTVDRLFAYDWPGNVRELKNVVEAAAKWAEGPSEPISHIRVGLDLSVENTTTSQNSISFDPLKESLNEVESRARRKYFARLLDLFRGDVERIAERAGISRSKAYALKKEIEDERK